MSDQVSGNSLMDWPDMGQGELSPRQRVQMALAHREPDRVPADLWAVPEVWERLQSDLGAASPNEVLQRLHVDVRWVVPDYVGPQRALPGGITVDAFGAWRKDVEHNFGAYSEYAGYPLAEARSVADVHDWDWSPTEYWDMEGVRSQLADLDTEGEYFICYDVGGIFERSWGLRGLSAFLMDLAGAPEIAGAIMDRMTDLYIDNVSRLLDAGEGRIDMVYTWDDIAHQRGLFISPQMWQEHIVPRHQRLNAAIRQYDVKLMYHSCGAIFPLIPSLIKELGIDVLNPLQPRARGMDMEKIKAEFGRQVAFHGGVDLQHTLPHGTPAEVRAEVRERCSVLGQGGGYILAPAHYIQNDVPTENILAMYRTPREL